MSVSKAVPEPLAVIERLRDAIEAAASHRVILGAVIDVPAGVVAPDGVGIRVPLAVCRADAAMDARIGGSPEMVLELAPRRRPRLHDLAWRWFGVEDVWLLDPLAPSLVMGGGVGRGRTVDATTGECRVSRPGWSCTLGGPTLFG